MTPFRHAARRLRRSPGFTTAAVLCLALGVGVNSVVFGSIDAQFHRSPPPGVARPNEVFELFIGRDSGAVRSAGTQAASYADYLDAKDGSPSLAGLAAYRTTMVTLGRGAGAEQVVGHVTSPNYYTLLGVAPERGRFPASDERGVVVVSHDFWQRRLGGAQDAVGRAVRLNGQSFTVVGVAPPGFAGVQPAPVDFFAPLADAPLLSERRSGFVVPRYELGYSLLVRLREDHSAARAQSELKALFEHAATTAPNMDPTPDVRLLAITAWYGPDGAPMDTLPLLPTAIGASILLIACANLANLLLARGAARRQELSVRVSLGASRWQVARELLAEALLLAVMGGAAAICVGVWSTKLLVGLFGGTSVGGGVSGRVALYAFGVALFAVLLAGLAPALDAARTPPASALGDGARGTGSARARLRSALLAGQFALSLLLLVGAGLFLRSLRNMQALPSGYDLAHSYVVSLDLGARELQSSDVRAYYQRLRDRVAGLPGVRAAAVGGRAPFEGMVKQQVRLPGRPTPTSAEDFPTLLNVSPEYFEAVGIAIRRGRTFDEAERSGQRPAIVVSEEMARRYWPDGDPLDRCVVVGFEKDAPCAAIVGVAADARHMRLTESPIPAIYVPIAQGAEDPSSSLFVRIAGDGEAFTRALRHVAAELDPDVPFITVRPMRTLVEGELVGYRGPASMLSLFSALALLLASVGLYGVMSYTVAQRTREIGVRLALGARTRDIMQVVLRRATWVIAAGSAAGIAASLAVSRVLRSQLFGISPTDPPTIAVATAVLATSALVAAYLPARRAARVDPTIALRSE